MGLLDSRDVSSEFIDSEEDCKGNTKNRTKIDIIMTMGIEL